jgi:hypothetical protein
MTGCSPCAADCTGKLTVGMTIDFADGKARAAAASHACGTSSVLTEWEKAVRPDVRTCRAGATHAFYAP